MIVLSCFLVLCWLVGTTPAFNWPLGPELLAFAVFFHYAARLPTLWHHTSGTSQPGKQARHHREHALHRRGLRQQKGFMLLLVVGLIALCVSLAWRGWLGQQSLQATFGHPPCLTMPNPIMQVECWFQAAVNQVYWWRTLSYSLAASALFLLAFLWTKVAATPLIPAAMLSVGSSLVVLTVGAEWQGQAKLFPDWIMYVDASKHPYSQLLNNRSWLWTYMTPVCLLALFYTTAVRSVAYRVVWALATLFLFWFLAAPGQRTALVGLALLISVGALWLVAPASRPLGERAQESKKPLGKKTSKNLAKSTSKSSSKNTPRTSPLSGLLEVFSSRRWVWFRMLGTLSGIGCLGVWVGYKLLHETSLVNTSLQSLGLHTSLYRMDRILPANRVEIWEAALNSLSHRLWDGFGYASWYAYGRFSATETIHGVLLHFDTAHNYFVQTLFELGVPHTLLICLFFAGLMLMSVRTSVRPARQAWCIALSLCMYVPMALAQELDFVRSAFYMHGLYWGWLLADGPQQWKGGLPSVSTFRTGALIPPFKPWRWLQFLGGGCLLAAVAVSMWFSLAGFPFEAGIHNQFVPRVRWLRSFGTITYVEPRSTKPQELVYPVAKTYAQSYVQKGPVNAPQHVHLLPGQREHYVSVSRRGLFSLPDVIDFTGAKREHGRAMSAMLNWPPMVTALPLVWSSGLHQWEVHESFAAGAWRWCGQHCAMRFRHCPAGQKREVWLQARRPDVSSLDPVRVFWHTTPTLQQGRFAEGSLSFVMSDPVEVQRLLLDNESRLSLYTPRPYQEVFADGQKGRSLGVLVLQSQCVSSV